MAKVSREKGSLIHDDSLDAVAGSVRKWVEHLVVDEKVRMEQKVTDENIEFFKEWGGEIGTHANGVLGSSRDRFNRDSINRNSNRKLIQRRKRQ